jgi:effector-binding domain-containing protein
MRFLKFFAIILAVLAGAYALSMYYFVDESKDFTVEKEINYPKDEVIGQFRNLQSFTRWNNFFSSSKSMEISYYQPYEGPGSSLSFFDKVTDAAGEVFVRYENPGKALRYQLFESENENPSIIDVVFSSVAEDKTKIKWMVHTPKLSVWKRAENLWKEDRFVDNIDKSMVNLKNVMSNKIAKAHQAEAIKYDTLMVENADGQILLGINVSTSNKKDALYKNVIMNYNKVFNYVSMDLGKREDEFGLPTLITNPNNYKDKEVSYFLGIPLPKRTGVSDNNFSFRTLNSSQVYVMYYKGNYANRAKVIQQLLQKAKSNTMRTGDLQQTFLEAPSEDGNVSMKFSLVVY